jgi:hypothetical protein
MPDSAGAIVPPWGASCSPGRLVSSHRPRKLSNSAASAASLLRAHMHPARPRPQEQALASTRERLEASLPPGATPELHLVRACHSGLQELVGSCAARVVVFNLGYLPSGDKGLTTKAGTTVAALEAAIEVQRAAPSAAAAAAAAAGRSWRGCPAVCQSGPCAARDLPAASSRSQLVRSPNRTAARQGPSQPRAFCAPPIACTRLAAAGAPVPPLPTHPPKPCAGAAAGRFANRHVLHRPPWRPGGIQRSDGAAC